MLFYPKKNIECLKKTQKDIEWENRTLCSDESCIGIIGPDGRCKECGLPYGGKPESSVAPDACSNSRAETDPESINSDTADEATIATTEDESNIEDTDAEWENRTLCSDESCIGVIGPNGRCKECDKPLSTETS